MNSKDDGEERATSLGRRLMHSGCDFVKASMRITAGLRRKIPSVVLT